MTRILTVVIMVAGLSGCGGVSSSKLSSGEVKGIVDNMSYTHDRFGNCLGVVMSKDADGSSTVVLTYVPKCGDGQ